MRLLILKYMHGVINAINRIVEVLKHVFVVRDSPHEKTHDGDHYFLNAFGDISVATTAYLLITPDSDVELHATAAFISEGEFEAVIYEDTTVSANGTPVAMNNRNRNSSKTTGAQVFIAPTITGAGNQLWASKVGTKKGGTSGAGNIGEVIFKRNTIYSLVFTKITGTTAWLEFLFDWYEKKPDHPVT